MAYRDVGIAKIGPIQKSNAIEATEHRDKPAVDSVDDLALLLK